MHDTAMPSAVCVWMTQAEVVARHVHGRVNGEARRVHALRRLVGVHGLAGGVDLHQVLRLHLVEQHAVAVDEEVVGRARNARADVRVDQVGHLEMRDQPVQRGQVMARAGFGVLDAKCLCVCHAYGC
jgi:hypothetical protein